MSLDAASRRTQARFTIGAFSQGFYGAAKTTKVQEAVAIAGKVLEYYPPAIDSWHYSKPVELMLSVHVSQIDDVDIAPNGTVAVLVEINPYEYSVIVKNGESAYQFRVDFITTADDPNYIFAANRDASYVLLGGLGALTLYSTASGEAHVFDVRENEKTIDAAFTETDLLIASTEEYVRDPNTHILYIRVHHIGSDTAPGEMRIFIKKDWAVNMHYRKGKLILSIFGPDKFDFISDLNNPIILNLDYHQEFNECVPGSVCVSPDGRKAFFFVVSSFNQDTYKIVGVDLVTKKHRVFHHGLLISNIYTWDFATNDIFYASYRILHPYTKLFHFGNMSLASSLPYAVLRVDTVNESLYAIDDSRFLKIDARKREPWLQRKEERDETGKVTIYYV